MTQAAAQAFAAERVAIPVLSVLETITAGLAGVNVEDLTFKAPKKCEHYKVVGVADDATRRAFGLLFELKKGAEELVRETNDKTMEEGRAAEALSTPEAVETEFDRISNAVKVVTVDLDMRSMSIQVVRALAHAEAVRQFPELAGQSIRIETDGSLGYADHSPENLLKEIFEGEDGGMLSALFEGLEGIEVHVVGGSRRRSIFG